MLAYQPKDSKPLSLGIWCCVICVLLYGASLQIFYLSNFAFNWDVAWLLHATQLFLNGSHYYSGFFDISPPVFIYIYIPALLLTKLTHLNTFITCDIYAFALAILSLLLCSHPAKIIAQNKKIFYLLILLCIAFCLTILPINRFAQREHFMVILVLPYIFLTILRTQNKQVNLPFVIIVATHAAIGFSIKPFFYAPILLIEIYQIKTKQKWFFWLRTENIIIIIWAILYLISIFVFEPNYIYKIIPFAKDTYPVMHSFSLKTILLTPQTIFFYISTILFLLWRKRSQVGAVLDILILTAAGFFITYVIQLTPWYYHIYPCLTFATISMVVIAYETTLAAIKKQSLAAILYFSWCVAALFFIPLAAPYALITSYAKSPGRIQYNKAINYLKKLNNQKSIFVISLSLRDSHPLSEYSNMKNDFYMNSLALLPGIEQMLSTTNDSIKKRRLQKEKDYILNSIITTLKNHPPEIILVNHSLRAPILIKKPFHTLQHLLRHPEFKKIFSNYRPIKSIANYQFYLRKPSSSSKKTLP